MRWWLIALGACSIHGEADLVNHCEGEECIPCASDDACVIAHNPCTETAVCGHVDDELAVVQIGCSEALEYTTPEPERCQCVQEVCQATE